MTPNVPPPEHAGVRAIGGAACGHCGAAFDARAWDGLDLVELVATERVRAHVTIWPRGARIEVRRCRCGRALARTRATSG